MKVEAVKIQIIENWSELDNHSVMKVLQFIQQNQLLKALILLSDMTLEYYTSLPKYMQYELRKLVKMFALKPFDHILINDFKVGYFKKVRFVKADLSDITCKQWLNADYYFTQLSEGKEPVKNFDLLVASLVFLKDKTLTNKKIVSKIAKLKHHEKEYISRRFLHIKKQVHVLLKNQKMIDESTEENENDEVQNFGWNGIFQDIAERGVFGNMSELMHIKFIDVLMYLMRNKIINDKILEDRNRKKAIAEAKQ